MKPRNEIARYFQQVSRVVTLCRAVVSQDIRADERTPTEGFLRGDLTFRDGSRLHFRELVKTEPAAFLVSYT